MTIPVDLKPIDELVEALLAEADVLKLTFSRQQTATLCFKAARRLESQASLICEAIGALETLCGAMDELDRIGLSDEFDAAQATLAKLKGES